MNLYILRHAKAKPHRRQWDPDSKRPLTEEGEKQARQVAAGMARMAMEFDIILTSPYVRAYRTAEVVAQTLDCAAIQSTQSLVSEADPKHFINEIKEKHGTAGNILLVGHEPYLSNLMSILLTGKTDLKIDFKKAGLAKLSVEHGLRFGKCACLHWLLTPKQLASLKK